MAETMKCQKYAHINKENEDITQVQMGDYIEAFIKNYQKYCVYCSIGVGISGIVMDKDSMQQLESYYDIGDVIQCQVEGFKKTGHIIIRYLAPVTQELYIPAQCPPTHSHSYSLNQG